MDRPPAHLALFPLELVLLPGELLPLHVFEERYKRLVNECLEGGGPFGIVLRLGDGVAAIGCSARLVAVLERFADGRSNIVVRGEEPFRILEIHVPDDAESEPMRATVEFLTDDSDVGTAVAEKPDAADPGGDPPGHLEALLARLRALREGEPEAGGEGAEDLGEAAEDPGESAEAAAPGYEAAPGEGPESAASASGAGGSVERSYRIAADLDLELANKQRLLESRSEVERLLMLTDHLETLVPRLELFESRREAIRGNGKGD